MCNHTGSGRKKELIFQQKETEVISFRKFKTHFYIFALLSLSLISCESSKLPSKQEDLDKLAAELKSKEAETQVTKAQIDKFNDGTPIITSETLWKGKDTLQMLFAGDIMAHKPNWANGHYDEIYEDITGILKESDFAFGNLETPLDEDKPYSTYPQFNIHKEYADAAINAGFNVFSLANNHTNDQGLSGIKATKKATDEIQENTKSSERPVYASGLKNAPEDEYSFCIMEKNGWKILYLAVTEILNAPGHSSYINYISTSANARKKFVEYIIQLREQNPCDLFVLSIHTSEPEYILTVTKTQRTFYYELLDAGVDVVWANHPHVAREWEVLTDENNHPHKIIFYSQGNTISAQRTNPSYHFPTLIREYTGDGYMTQVRFIKDDSGIHIVNVNPILITTYITPSRLFIIKQITDSFIQELKEQKLDDWSLYLQKRKELMSNIKGKIKWQ